MEIPEHKILGNRKSFLIWQCYTKKENIKVSNNTKQKKKEKENKLAKVKTTQLGVH